MSAGGLGKWESMDGARAGVKDREVQGSRGTGTLTAGVQQITELRRWIPFPGGSVVHPAKKEFLQNPLEGGIGVTRDVARARDVARDVVVQPGQQDKVQGLGGIMGRRWMQWWIRNRNAWGGVSGEG